MKICIVTPKVIKGDGQGRANYEIVWEAIRRGHQVTLLAYKVDEQLQNHDLVQWINSPVQELSTALTREVAFLIWSTLWLQKNRAKFDLVQVYGSVTWAIGDINTAQFVHHAWLNSPLHISKVRGGMYGAYQWFYSALNSYIERRAFQKAKMSIAVSQRVKQELIEIGVPQEHIQVIFNGVDTSEFVPGTANRQQWKLPEEVTLALFAGDIRLNRKNLDQVLKALVQVPDLHLAVVGDTKRSPYLQLAASLGLSNRVHFLGYRRDLPEIMKAVDMFVFPSRYEPFGMVVTEAMATGLPVITASTTGAAEVIDPESGVVICDPEDTKSLAEAMKKLQTNPELRKNMGQAARFVAQQHTWQSKAKLYVDIFESFLNPETKSFNNYQYQTQEQLSKKITSVTN